MVGSKLSTGNPQLVHTGREYAEKKFVFLPFFTNFFRKKC